MISQAAAALARLRARLGGGATADEIIPEIRATEGDLLGPRGALLRSVDAKTAAHLLGTPEAVRVWVDLLRLEAEALSAGGRQAQAELIAARASQLEQAIASVAPPRARA